MRVLRSPLGSADSTWAAAWTNAKSVAATRSACKSMNRSKIERTEQPARSAIRGEVGFRSFHGLALGVVWESGARAVRRNAGNRGRGRRAPGNGGPGHWRRPRSGGPARVVRQQAHQPALKARQAGQVLLEQTASKSPLTGELRQFVRQGRLKGLLYYAWTDDKYGIYRCDALTDSGQLIFTTNLK